MNKKFLTYIEPARTKPEIWRILITLVISGILLILITSGIFYLGKLLFPTFLLELTQSGGKFTTPKSMYIILLSFLLWIIAFSLSLRLIHKRHITSVIGSNWYNIKRYFIIAIIIHSSVSLLGFLYLFEPQNYIQQFEIHIWLQLLPLGLVLMLLQVSAEEIIFRGYLLQQLAVRFKQKWVFLILPAILFGLGHYNKTYGVEIALSIVLATTLFGIFLADITYRTGNLGAAIGIHFSNNLFAMFIISYQEELSGLALFIAPEYFKNPLLFNDSLWIEIGYMLMLMAIYYAYIGWRKYR